MVKFSFSILVVCVILMSCHNVGHDRDFLQIWSLPYTWRVPVGYTIDNVINHDSASYYEIDDQSLLNSIREKLQEFKGKKVGGFDVRLVCIVHSRSHIDTVAFGSYSMYYEGQEKYIDVGLLKLIGQHLNRVESEEIKQWIEDWDP